MRLHPKLVGFEHAKHIKRFNKILKQIESDLKKLGVTDFDAEIAASGRSRSLAQRFFGLGQGDFEELMTVLMQAHGCPVEIAVPMGAAGVAPPFMLQVILPVPMTGSAEYRRGTLRTRWHVEPEDKSRVADLKRTLPKVKMKQTQTSHREAVEVVWKVPIGHLLEPTGEGRTAWILMSAYEGGALTGGNRPQVGKYLEVIPAVEAMLRKWSEPGGAVAGSDGI